MLKSSATCSLFRDRLGQFSPLLSGFGFCLRRVSIWVTTHIPQSKSLCYAFLPVKMLANTLPAPFLRIKVLSVSIFDAYFNDFQLIVMVYVRI